MDLLERIATAFQHTVIPSPAEILAERFRDFEEPGEMAADFCGKHWQALSRETLFKRREMLVTLSPIGYQAYIPAYLSASLADGDDAADLRDFTLLSLRPIKKERSDEDAVRTRLSMLDPDQRAVIGAFVRHFLNITVEAERVLSYLHSSSFF